uniref:Uncharacterized protein n=2 Tax=Caenorhabditis japonica TaxID=281687 RepID=A0A8R1E621_CAEJA
MTSLSHKMTFSHFLDAAVETQIHAQSSSLDVFELEAMQAKTTVFAPSAPIWISKYQSSEQIAHFAQHKAVRSLQAGDTSLTWEIPDGEYLRMAVVEQEPRRTRLSVRLLSPYN